MTQYKLVNPTIIGSLNTTVKTNSPDSAMKQLWENLSEHLVGNVPNLLVTIREEGTKNLFHYNIKEKVNSEKNAEISYDKIDVKLSTKERDSFLKEINRVSTQHGSGDKKKRNRYDDDDSDSSESESEDEYYKFMKFRKNTPISMYWYTPVVYASTGTLKVYTPVWRYPIVPYNEIWIPKVF